MKILSDENSFPKSVFSRARNHADYILICAIAQVITLYFVTCNFVFNVKRFNIYLFECLIDKQKHEFSVLFRQFSSNSFSGIACDANLGAL